MDMGQGNVAQAQGGNSNSAQGNSKVDVNTDTLQKLVLSAQEQASEQVKDPSEAGKTKESVSPLQHLLKGNEKDAKQELLKEFIHKVASSEQDILFAGDQGKKNVDLMGEMKLLFGQDSMKNDEVTLSSQAKLMEMSDGLAQSQAATALKKELMQTDENTKADNHEKLEKQIFEEKSGVRDKVAGDKLVKPKGTEEKDQTLANFDKSKSSEEEMDQDNSGRNRKDQQEIIDDDDTIAINKLKQQIAAEVEEVEDEDVVDEIEEVDIEEAQKKEAKDKQIAGVRDKSLEAVKDKESSDSTKVRKKETEAVKEAAPARTKEEMMVKYTDHYRKYLMVPDKDLDSLMKNEEELLKDHGLTSRQVKDIQQAVKKTVKQEIRSKIKDAITQKQLSIGNKLDSLTADTRLNKFTDYFVSNLLLGGQDFGGFDDTFQGMVNKAMYFASKDLANFSIEEMQDFVMEESLDPSKTKVDKIKDFEARVTELNSITNNPKVTEEWAQTAMEAFMKDYGLAREKEDFSANATAGASVNVMSSQAGMSQDNKQKQHHGYEFDEKDEKDIFLNRLRALYLQRAMNPGISTSLKTEFKMRKLKNGLVRMGVFTEVLNEQVSKEAEEIAKDRTMDMLKEALEERASLYDLRGTAYDLLENKMKGILKNAERLGLEISKEQFNKLRDEINYRMLETTKKQMELLEVRLSEEDFPQLVLRYREMQKLVDRLKEESGITNNEVGNEKFHNITIAESA